MNFFKLYIGDYMRDTGTLTLAQHGAYMQMLMQHYATEAPLPTGRELYRLLRADSKAERDAIDFIAAKFWALTAEGWINDRAGKELEKAGEVSDTNRAIALAREAKKRAEKEHEQSTKRAPSVLRTEHEQSTNQTPDTRHQKNPSGSKGERASAPSRPDEVSEQTWGDWLTLRAKKRAPVTVTVIEEARREAIKAGMPLGRFLAVWCARGSQGLRAEWLKPAERAGSHAGFQSKSYREGVTEDGAFA
jgi:uncharacterized protein YdaU (DUF1376 family)